METRGHDWDEIEAIDFDEKDPDDEDIYSMADLDENSSIKTILFPGICLKMHRSTVLIANEQTKHQGSAVIKRRVRGMSKAEIVVKSALVLILLPSPLASFI